MLTSFPARSPQLGCLAVLVRGEAGLYCNMHRSMHHRITHTILSASACFTTCLGQHVVAKTPRNAPVACYRFSCAGVGILAQTSQDFSLGVSYLWMLYSLSPGFVRVVHPLPTSQSTPLVNAVLQRHLLLALHFTKLFLVPWLNSGKRPIALPPLPADGWS